MNRQFDADMCNDCSCSSREIVRHWGCPYRLPKQAATPPSDRGVMLLGAVLLALFWGLLFWGLLC